MADTTLTECAFCRRITHCIPYGDWHMKCLECVELSMWDSAEDVMTKLKQDAMGKLNY